MKTKKISSLVILSAISATAAFSQSSFIYEDDLYYNPKEENKIVKEKKAERKQSIQQELVTEIRVPASTTSANINLRDVDEYNRRNTNYNTGYTDQDNYTQEYYEEVPQQQFAEADKTVNIYFDAETDYVYSNRIRKFHNKEFTLHLTPEYSQVNIYVEQPYSNRWDYGWYSPS